MQTATLEGNRFFIPMVPPQIKPETLLAVSLHTSWIGINLFQLKHSSFYEKAKSKGVRDAFGINDKIKIFLTTINDDNYLVNYFNKSSWFEELKSDLNGFSADMVMGPDWFSYREDSPELRNRNIKKAIDLNLMFTYQENIIPTIRGNYSQEIKRFIKPFKEIGKNLFVFTGREYLINLGDRKRSEFELLSLTSNIVRNEKVKLIVTGCSSPRQQENLPDVFGFSGLGWLINAKRRMLISGKTYRWLSSPIFSCADPDCCNSMNKSELAQSKNDSIRAIHNLKAIIARLNTAKHMQQSCLGDFDG